MLAPDGCCGPSSWPGTSPPRVHTRYSQTQYQEVIELKKKGLSCKMISELIKIPYQTVYYWFSKGTVPYIAWNEDRKNKFFGHLSEVLRKDNVKPVTSRQWARRIKNAKEGEFVHHIDENPCNNDPCNLQIVTPKEHSKIHIKKQTRDYHGRFVCEEKKISGG